MSINKKRTVTVCYLKHIHKATMQIDRGVKDPHLEVRKGENQDFWSNNILIFLLMCIALPFLFAC